VGADVFGCGLRHDAALLLGPVIADFSQRAIDLSGVSGRGLAKSCIPDGMDVAKTVNQGDGPGPRPPVHRRIEAELCQVEFGYLQRQRHVDGRSALIN
jgi:hypothetical protein